MLEQPTLSVVMPNYNHARFLPEALRAILAQSYRPLEVIVIDDGSTDNSVEVIEDFAHEDPLVRLYRNDQNRGPLFSGNRGLEMASGEYVYGAAADDKVLPGFFEKSMSLLARYPQAGLCSTLSRLIDETGKDKGIVQTPIISKQEFFLSPEEALQTLRQHGSWTMGNTSIYRRQALIEAGGFIPELGPFCDGFIQQVIALRYGACFIPEPLAAWRRMETGYASTTGANTERSLEIRQHAGRLMRSTYSDLFPPDYVAKWERQYLYTVGLSAWGSVCRQQDQFLTKCHEHLLPASSWLDRLFLSGLRLSVQAQALAVKLYFFVRHMPRAWLLRRVLKRILGRSRAYTKFG